MPARGTRGESIARACRQMGLLEGREDGVVMVRAETGEGGGPVDAQPLRRDFGPYRSRLWAFATKEKTCPPAAMRFRLARGTVCAVASVREHSWRCPAGAKHRSTAIAHCSVLASVKTLRRRARAGSTACASFRIRTDRVVPADLGCSGFRWHLHSPIEVVGLTAIRRWRLAGWSRVSAVLLVAGRQGDAV